MRPADTEVIPEKRDYKSVPYLGGKEQELKYGGNWRRPKLETVVETLALMTEFG